MKKWVRWWGLIAFCAVVALITVFWLFFVDGIVRRVVERTGTALAGAEVDVAKASLTFSPLGIALSGIQVTDPKAPARNSVEIGRVAFSLDGLNLLRRKVIVQEMTADGLRFGTARKKPGFVAKPEKKPEAEKKKSAFTLPSFEMPDVKKILANETFDSVKLIDDARADVQKKKDEWQKRVSTLPNKAALDAYRARLDKLKASSRSGLKDIVGTAGDAKKLKDDIDRDLQTVRKTRADLNTDLASVKGLVAKAEQAPLDDVRRIREKYSLSLSGLQNMSHALFGEKITSWMDSGLYWYNHVTPYLSSTRDNKKNVKVAKPVRGRGVDVKFPEHAPLPDFLIRTVKASLQSESGSYSGTIRNITTDQDVLGIPLTFQLDGARLSDVQDLSVSGALDHIHPAGFKDSIHLQAQGYRAGNMVLSTNKELPISLQDGLMDIDVNGLRGPEGFRATLVAKFKSIKISSEKQAGGSAIRSALSDALSRVSSFTLTADITGEPGNYDVKVSSDLDRVFKDSVGRLVQEQGNRLEQELKTAVQSKTSEKLKDLKAGQGSLDSFGGNIDGVQNQLNALLQETTQKSGGKLKLPF
ncbi:MAG TPA: TIGR03545 family protein [Nitrospirota bacterium]